MISSLFHSPHPLIVGSAPYVGVLDLKGTHQRPPLRLFFPADTTIATNNNSVSRRKLKPASYFVNNRVAYILQGFAHIAFARHTTKLHRFILRPLLWLFSFIFPARWLKIPDTVLVTKENISAVKYHATNENTSSNKSQSLVMFSHGLTGTGEENSIFCTALAKRGYVVASLHHRDGSSSRVPMSDGSCQYYKHFPTGEEYSPKHRLQQVHVRANELLYCTKWMMGEKETLSDNDNNEEHAQLILDQIRPSLSKDNINAVGFSYGAATVSLAATLEPKRYQSAVLLDPWLHIDFSSKGIEFDFPPEAFGHEWPSQAKADNGNGNGNDDKEKIGLNIPSIIINSSQFAGYKKLYSATNKLAQRTKAKLHVLPETTHQNFCDTVFWLPRRWGKKLFGLGNANGYDSYCDIVTLTYKFLEDHS